MRVLGGLRVERGPVLSHAIPVPVPIADQALASPRGLPGPRPRLGVGDVMAPAAHQAGVSVGVAHGASAVGLVACRVFREGDLSQVGWLNASSIEA